MDRVKYLIVKRIYDIDLKIEVPKDCYLATTAQGDLMLLFEGNAFLTVYRDHWTDAWLQRERPEKLMEFSL